MKFIYSFIIFFGVVSGAQSEQNHDLKLAILDDLLAEGHISQLEYNKKSSSLSNVKLKQRTIDQLKTQDWQAKSGPGGDSSITGLVTLSGVGVQGVVVYLRDFATGAWIDVVSTDPLGVYTFSNVNAGSYYISIDGQDDHISM